MDRDTVLLVEEEPESDQHALFLIEDLPRAEDVIKISVDKEEEVGQEREAEQAHFSSPVASLLNPTSLENMEKVAGQSSQIREQRELKLEEVLEEKDSVEGGSGKKADELLDSVRKFEQDKEEGDEDDNEKSEAYQSIPSASESEPVSSPSLEEEEKRLFAKSSSFSKHKHNNNSGRKMKPKSKSKLVKPKPTGNIEQEKRFLKPIFTDSEDSLESNNINNKKGIIMKMKSELKKKGELVEIEKDDGELDPNNPSPDSDDVQSDEQEFEFVAPKLIQRGFHPILPYSEKDPGPIVVPMAMQPKVEKLLPPGPPPSPPTPEIANEQTGPGLAAAPPSPPIMISARTGLFNNNGPSSFKQFPMENSIPIGSQIPLLALNALQQSSNSNSQALQFKKGFMHN